MRISIPAFVLCLLFSLSGCVAAGDNGAFNSAVTPAPIAGNTVSKTEKTSEQITEQSELPYGQPTAIEQPWPSRRIFASQQRELGSAYRSRNKKTYLINGLASSVESIGYGFTNLSKKIPGSVLHNYASVVESSTIIRSKVTRELKAAYRRDQNIAINLIGISFGANIVTLIAADLDRAGVPVNYLVTLEGPAMVAIGDNVKTADNFSCTNLDCFRTKPRLAWGNRVTKFSTFKIKSSHIPLADHRDVHRRILSVINRRPPPLVTTQ